MTHIEQLEFAGFSVGELRLIAQRCTPRFEIVQRDIRCDVDAHSGGIAIVRDEQFSEQRAGAQLIRREGLVDIGRSQSTETVCQLLEGYRRATQQRCVQ